mmetsp:Transcript_1062/g.1522  ORF Transcript_1062/g.1522 Transcript_1062/m.1522 type:complete len:484 (-) Transcript_1062:212-1663(-)|eukprot:CAMPEP_0116036052 /NCGR_PEP_ID=MMETSP0321-20121206/20876_1 /TAXON_ID=163516 /ORGANISM="Leptocylindrus danicus var. danicus, Strain B650" /LENGTH=483 /DNA_ID=CAMNT_0003513287 /DNA_START=140 /DNA_END=1591 /DNA_ORIENTATION=+
MSAIALASDTSEDSSVMQPMLQGGRQVLELKQEAAPMSQCDLQHAGESDAMSMTNVVDMTETCEDRLCNGGSIELSSEAIFRENLDQISTLPTTTTDKVVETSDNNCQETGDRDLHIINEGTGQNTAVLASVDDGKREPETTTDVAGRRPRKMRKKMKSVKGDDRHDEQWYVMLQKHIGYKKDHGSYAVPRDYDFTLHSWVRRQQQKYTYWKYGLENSLECKKKRLGRCLNDKKAKILEREGLVDVSLGVIDLSRIHRTRGQSRNGLPSCDSKEDYPFLSMRVAKFFINGDGLDQLFFGTVTTVRAQDQRNMYAVVYDDGDREDAWEEELHEMITTYEANKNADLKNRKCSDEEVQNASGDSSPPPPSDSQSSESGRQGENGEAKKHLMCASEANVKSTEEIKVDTEALLREEIKQLKTETHELKSELKQLKAVFQSDLHILKTAMVKELHEMKDHLLRNVAHNKQTSSDLMNSQGDYDASGV